MANDTDSGRRSASAVAMPPLDLCKLDDAIAALDKTVMETSAHRGHSDVDAECIPHLHQALASLLAAERAALDAFNALERYNLEARGAERGGRR